MKRFPPLREALHSDDRFVAGRAAVALADIGDAEAQERLVRFVRDYDYSQLRDPFSEVWEQAVMVLGGRQVRAAV